MEKEENQLELNLSITSRDITAENVVESPNGPNGKKLGPNY